MPQAVQQHITPRLPRALPDKARNLVSRAIEAHQAAIDGLIAFLDAADGNTDEEDGGDGEPSLGSLTSSCTPDNQCLWGWGNNDDCEEEHDGREPDVDHEPSLAFTNDVNQEVAQRHASGLVYAPHSTAWHGFDSDLEAEHDGSEPSLGALNPSPPSTEALPGVWNHNSGLDQTDWGAGDRRDLEAEEGV